MDYFLERRVTNVQSGMMPWPTGGGGGGGGGVVVG